MIRSSGARAGAAVQRKFAPFLPTRQGLSACARCALVGCPLSILLVLSELFKGSRKQVGNKIKAPQTKEENKVEMRTVLGDDHRHAVISCALRAS